MLQIEGRFLEFNVGVRLVRIDGRSQLPMLDLQDDLRQAGNSCRRLRVSDIGFHGTDRTELLFRGLLLKRLGQCRNFNAVSQLCARAMAFHITNRLRMNSRLLECVADQMRLRVWIRSGISVRPATMIESACRNDSVNMILIAYR